jgi:hypothetical protein
VEYFLKALEEIYAVSEVDRFGESAAVWRAVVTKLQTTTQVDYTNAGLLHSTAVRDEHQAPAGQVG